MQVLQDQVALQESLDHLASLEVLEPRATKACKGLRDPRVFRGREVRARWMEGCSCLAV